MSTEPDTGGLLLRPKSVQLVPVIFEKDEEPPEPSRGGVSCSLEKLMTVIRSLFRGEVLRVYREQEREARASISLGGTHTHYVQYDWNRSQLIVLLVQPIYLQCLCIGLRNKRPSLDYCCAIHSLLCVCVGYRRWVWRCATLRLVANSQPMCLTSVVLCLSVSSSLDQTMRDWWIRSSGILVGVTVVCLHCTMTGTLVAFVCVHNECTAEYVAWRSVCSPCDCSLTGWQTLIGVELVPE